MANGIVINPYLPTVGDGLFTLQSDGLRQGTAFPDRAIRNAQRTGILASDETLPMWGGVGIYEFIPYGSGNHPNEALGPIVGRATALTGAKQLAGFSVFDGAYAMITTPQSRAPQAAPGGQVMSYALGSRARIVVGCDPTLISLWGTKIQAQVSWDFVAQRLVPYLGTLTITSGTYNNTTGVITLVMSAPVTFEDGDAVILSALTGTGAFASLNGTWMSIDPVGGTTVTIQATPALGASTITGGSLTLGSGASSALDVTVLDVQESNCMQVTYDPVTGFANYDYDGSCAVIQI